MDKLRTLLDRLLGLVEPYGAIGLAVVAILLVLCVWWVIRARRPRSIAKLLSAISFEKLENVVLPKADEGEIHIEHILLTQGGLYVIDPKEIRGIVFGSDKMHDWTVLDDRRRYTIANPQGPLFDRVAAVRQIVKNIPVKGCILFGAEADFSKGRPAHVYTEEMLRNELPSIDGARASQLRASFDAEWQKLRDAAFSGAT